MPSQEPVSSSLLLGHVISRSKSGDSARKGSGMGPSARSRGALGSISRKSTAPVAAPELQMLKLAGRRGTAKATSNSSGKRFPQTPAAAAAAGRLGPAKSAAAAAAMVRKESTLEKQEAALRAKVRVNSVDSCSWVNGLVHIMNLLLRQERPALKSLWTC